MCEYNNKLLNHLELLASAFKLFGMSKAIDLSKRLSEELVSEAVRTNDLSMVLAGLISLEN